jgi:pimeloyl-ACP methyl ester carboxylesterase
MTRPGRGHPELVRFVRGVVGTGARVLVPEIREWRQLRFAPERSQEIIRAAVSWLHEQEGTTPGGIVLVGFSFGAPQALLAAADPGFVPKVRGVVGWGGYADVGRLFRFALTGEHEWEGREYRVRPDPYGRWVIGANCLAADPSIVGYREVADALRGLASEAGDRRIPAGDASLDPVKVALRRKLPQAHRKLFDLFAPPAERDPDPAEAAELVDRLVPEVRRVDPLLEPVPRIDEIRAPVRLLHGRGDLLVPFTETLRVGAHLSSATEDLSTRVTGLFAHSAGAVRGGTSARLKEGVRFVAALAEIFSLR